jgi:membrane associated rhomboid family serine protease
MRGRYPAPSGISYSFGPGPITPAVKALLIANIAAYVVTFFWPAVQLPFMLHPQAVVERGHVWQIVTYMFLHDIRGLGHLFFNMLMLWMIGVELERMWGTRYFTKFYFACGLGAGLTQILLGFLPGSIGSQFYDTATIGASGALYGLLLAYALYFPTRPFLIFFIFPVQARYLVMILGGISLLFALGGAGGVAHTAHLGGLATGYFYLKGKRLNLLSEIQYRYLKWRINRMRKKFDVYSGGRGDDVNRRVH